MKKIYLILAGCLLICKVVFPLPGPVTTLGSVTVCPGDLASVAVTVEEFNDVGGISLTVNYEGSMLQFENVVLNPAIAGSITNGSTPGVFLLSYTCNPGISLPDNDTLFSLIFSYTGAPEGGTSIISWPESPVEANEYSTADGIAYDKVPFEDFFFNGSVTADPDGCGPVTIAPEISITCVGSPIAIPVTIRDFDNIGGISLVINYDEMILTYLDIILNPVITGSLVNGATPGVVLLSFTSDTAVSLPDDDILFTLLFNYCGPSSGGASFLSWAETPVEANEYSTPEGIAYPKVPFDFYFIDGNISIVPVGYPSLNCPDTLYAVCDLPLPYEDFTAFINAGGSATDECGIDDTTFTWTGDVSDGSANPETITRTYSIRNHFGQEAICEQTIIIDILKVETWVYLEGAAIVPRGPTRYHLPMKTLLNELHLLPGQCYGHIMYGINYSPPGQPYNAPPWNYDGNEGDAYDSGGDPEYGAASYPEPVVDWVLVSLRNEPDGQPLCQKAALLNNDGSVSFTDGGFQCCELDGYNSFYLVIEHRNHLIIMSDTAIKTVNGTLAYDFRFRQSYLGDQSRNDGGNGQKEINSGVYAMYSGNSDQCNEIYSDTDLNFDDNVAWGGQNCQTGRYRAGDFNMNGDCNFNDRIIWELNNGIYTFVPR